MEITSLMENSGGSGTPNDRLKRKTPPDDNLPGPQAKAAKTNSNTISINYLVRQFNEDLPLISNDDTLPSLLSLLSDYQGVLDRHESMACNLGARPLGPILIKRFERLFDGPPKVLKSHGKEGATVTWLDIVEFARNKPEQFTLGQMSEGVRVCQFYTKQCRVQISEEDFLLISSGIPQKMIPPQPIVEDEEKELGTIEILEKTLSNICQLADSVAARTRQLNHRLKGRKQAILDRRASDNPPAARASSPATQELLNGAHASGLTQSPNSGFVAVNTKSHADTNGGQSGHAHTSSSSKNAASSATHDELRNKFFTLSERRQQSSSGDVRRPSISQHPSSTTVKRGTSYQENPEYTQSHTSPVPIPNTPSSLLPHHNPAPARTSVAEKDDGGPYKAEMVARMESLAKNERIMPPCDRCRRLHMDCLKNLTACVGCTRKHAKCSWREVRESEIRGGHSAPSSTASNVPLGLGADDLDDEPASVGQRTPPHYTRAPAAPVHVQNPNSNPAVHQQSQHQQQAAAAAAALQHHNHSHPNTHAHQSGLRSPPHHMHATSNTHSPSRVRSPADHHRPSHSHHNTHSHYEPPHHDPHPHDTHSHAPPSRNEQHSPSQDVTQQLQEAARLAQVESEAQAQQSHVRFEQPAMGVSGYQNPNVGAGHVNSGIEA